MSSFLKKLEKQKLEGQGMKMSQIMCECLQIIYHIVNIYLDPEMKEVKEDQEMEDEESKDQIQE